MLLNIILFSIVNASINARIAHAMEYVALATLAVGERARSFTTTLIHSYVRNGGVNVPLYIVTEDESYFESTVDAIDVFSELVLQNNTCFTPIFHQQGNVFNSCTLTMMPTIR
jgi:hypothetical protein